MTYSPPTYDPVTPASGGAPRHDSAFYSLAERRHGLSRTIRDDVQAARTEVINGVNVGAMADTLRGAYYARQGAARTRPELVVHGGFTGGERDPATGRRLRPLRAVWRFAPGAAETLAAEVLLTAGAEAPYVLADYRALRRIVRSVLEPSTRGARVDALVRSSGGSLDVAEAQRADADTRRRRDDDTTPEERRAVGILGTLAYGPTGSGTVLLKLSQAGEAGAAWSRRIYGELAGGAFRDQRRAGAIIAAGVRAHAAGVDPLTATVRPAGIYAVDFA